MQNARAYPCKPRRDRRSVFLEGTGICDARSWRAQPKDRLVRGTRKVVRMTTLTLLADTQVRRAQG